ncbi:MAG: hypothetical protein WC145_11620 [Aliarcobacter sp.]
MKEEESRPLVKKETALKATEYSKRHGIRPWLVYEMAIDLLLKNEKE